MPLKVFNKHKFNLDDVKKRMLFNYLEFFKKTDQNEDSFNKISFVVKCLREQNKLVLFNFKEKFDTEFSEIFVPFLSGYFILAEDFEEDLKVEDRLISFLEANDNVYNLVARKKILDENEQQELLICLKIFVENFPLKIEEFEKWF